MVYKELKIVWQTAKRIRRGLQPERNLEFLEFLAREGESVLMRRLALRQLLDLTAGLSPQSGVSARD